MLNAQLGKGAIKMSYPSSSELVCIVHSDITHSQTQAKRSPTHPPFLSRSHPLSRRPPCRQQIGPKRHIPIFAIILSKVHKSASNLPYTISEPFPILVPLALNLWPLAAARVQYSQSNGSFLSKHRSLHNCEIGHLAEHDHSTPLSPCC